MTRQRNLEGARTVGCRYLNTQHGSSVTNTGLDQHRCMHKSCTVNDTSLVSDAILGAMHGSQLRA
ncbi:hypothetical protein M378DRAFT_167070 [Amanita muscaria Koide BX008]|uniref:Uncharacterized protein n=1 Tax=Amanita muscaria (strain Koide BX008) TaxID=946122 RepID=A0A0C2WXZ4_AMAMK|nr:hypothetical protein M378DRAFT_167070 [Amanita muscaria Koide BX008]